MKKINVTVSMCISKDITLDVEENTLEDINEAFTLQCGYPIGVADLPKDGEWSVDEIEFIENN